MGESFVISKIFKYGRIFCPFQNPQIWENSLWFSKSADMRESFVISKIHRNGRIFCDFQNSQTWKIFSERRNVFMIKNLQILQISSKPPQSRLEINPKNFSGASRRNFRKWTDLGEFEGKLKIKFWRKKNNKESQLWTQF